jgi:hypothetical protein
MVAYRAFVILKQRAAQIFSLLQLASGNEAPDFGHGINKIYRSKFQIF